MEPAKRNSLAGSFHAYLLDVTDGDSAGSATRGACDSYLFSVDVLPNHFAGPSTGEAATVSWSIVAGPLILVFSHCHFPLHLGTWLANRLSPYTILRLSR